MPTIESLTFTNREMTVILNLGTEREPNMNKVSYEPYSERDMDLRQIINGIEIEAMKGPSKPRRSQHNNSSEPFAGYTLNYENDSFKIDKHVTSGFNEEIGVETNIWRKDKKSALHTGIRVPPYNPPYGGTYMVEQIGVGIGNQGGSYNLLPHGNIVDENAWELHKQFLKNTLYSALQLKPQEIARKPA